MLVKELLIYFDEGQAINESAPTRFQHQDSDGFSRQFAENNTTYNLERLLALTKKTRTSCGMEEKTPAEW